MGMDLPILNWDKRWKSSFCFYVGITSASYDFLVWLQNKVNDFLGIKGIINTCGNSAFQLVFAKNNSLALIEKLYPKNGKITYLARKKYKIDLALGIISQ